MSTQAVRIPSDAPLEDVIARTNRWLDVLMGNTGGRIRLRGDDGQIKNIRGGALLASGAFTIDASSLAGNQANLVHSNGSTVVLRAQDAGVLTAVPLSAQSTLAVTGAATLSSTLAVTGATTLTGALTANGAVTLGDAAADVITVVGTATFAQLATFTLGLTAVGPVIANGAVTLGDAVTDVITITGTIVYRSAAAGSTLQITLGRTADEAYFGIAGAAGQLATAAVAGDLVLRAQTTLILGSSGEQAIRIEVGPKIGLFGAAAVAQQSIAAAATDLPSVIALANDLRAKLRTRGDFS